MSNFGLGYNGLKEHILNRMDSEKLNIIVCDSEFNICDITEWSKKIFHVNIKDSVADFLDYDVCLKFRDVITTTQPATTYDKIDDIYFKIDVSEFRGNAILIFEDINHETGSNMSILANIATQIVGDYIDANEETMSIIQKQTLGNDIVANAIKSENDAMLNLFEFCVKMEILKRPDTIHKSQFVTNNISIFFDDFINQVKQVIDNCNVVSVIEPNIVCLHCRYMLTIAIINILYSIYDKNSIDNKVTIEIYSKNDKVYIVTTSENEFEMMIKYDKVCEEMFQNIIKQHNASILYKSNQVIISMPIILDNSNMLFSGIEYNKSDKRLNKLVKQLRKYNK